MFLISKFMKNYSYKFEEVIIMNWFTFNELLSATDAVVAEDNLKNLMIADNHLLVNCKDESKFAKLYKDLETKVKHNGYSHIEKVKSVSEIMKILGGA